MAIRDTTQFPQPVPSSSPLPTNIPLLPDDTLKRFPSLVQFNEDLDSWWRKARELLRRDHDDLALPLNRVLSNDDTVFAQKGNLLAEIRKETQARIDEDTALALEISTIASSTAGVHTFLQSSTPVAISVGDIWFDTGNGFRESRWDGTSWVLVGDTRIAGNVAAISSEISTRTSADTAIGIRIDAVLARLDTGDIATALSSLTAAVGPSGALATSITAISARLNTGDIATAISTLNAEAGPGGTLATSITAISARLNSGDIATAITALNTAVGPSGANATAITAISARLNSGDIATAISTLQTDVGPSGANATAITAISARLNTGGDIATSITSEASARATADGFLSGKYTLTVAAGNVVTGMNITSSTGTGTPVSSVIFQATNFQIYNGTLGLAPFTVSGGVVRITGDLVISTTDVTGLSTSLSGKIDTSGAAADVNANTTTISGSKIRAGTLESNNWGSGAGSQFDLTNGTFALGGSSSPALQWDGSTLTIHGILDVGTSDSRVYIDSSKSTFGYGTGNRTEIFHDTSTNPISGEARNSNSFVMYSGGEDCVHISATDSGGVPWGSIIVSKPDDSRYLEINGGNSTFLAAQTDGTFLNCQQPGDSAHRWRVFSDGAINWGGGVTGYDTNLYRIGANALQTDGDLSIGGSLRKGTADDWTPILNTGTHAISFKYDGQFKVKIDATEFVIF